MSHLQLHSEQLAHAGGHNHQLLTDRRVQPGQSQQHVYDAVSGIAVGIQAWMRSGDRRAACIALAGIASLFLIVMGVR